MLIAREDTDLSDNTRTRSVNTLINRSICTFCQGRVVAVCSNVSCCCSCCCNVMFSFLNAGIKASIRAMRPAISSIVSIGLKPQVCFVSCELHLLRSVNQLCSVTRTRLDNQNHHNRIHTLIAAIMNTFLETAQNDLIGEAVRWHVPTCACLHERQTTQNTGRTESTKLDRLSILSTLERGFFTV